MQETILICGYGPGISEAVANKFGGEGFQVSVVARNADKLDKAQGTLQARGVQAAAFPADLSGANAAKRLVTRVTSLGRSRQFTGTLM
ncbi:MAG TPA: SDR family NAD(P)-dependent oxidoreductase [Bryobacteraceae bacterium]|nr:SDR family NAD(P)-dependent oxidoreductase [Bryobacteraceae bacterium]